MAKRVLVACGNGVATSTVVAAKIKDYCADHGVAIQVTQCKMLELHDKANDYDLVVTSGKFKDADVKGLADAPRTRPLACGSRRPAFFSTVLNVRKERHGRIP